MLQSATFFGGEELVMAGKPNFFEKIIPFLVLGVFVVLLIAFFMLALYLLVWGVVIGAIIYLGFLIRNYFFPPKPPQQKSGGRTIEHDDL